MSYYYKRLPLYASICVVACSYPGDYGEEREGDCSPGCICPLVERQLISRGPRPLIGQEAETYKVQEGPETWQGPVRAFGKRSGCVISKLHLHTDEVLNYDFSNPSHLKRCFVPFRHFKTNLISPIFYMSVYRFHFSCSLVV